MIGFSIEFKPWFIVLRGPKGRIYLATGWCKELPIFTPTCTYLKSEFSKEFPVFTPTCTYLKSEYSTFIKNTTNYMSEHYDELEEERQYGIYK